MSQKSSLPQAAKSVSQVLTADSQLDPKHDPLVERVRYTKVGKPDKGANR